MGKMRIRNSVTLVFCLGFVFGCTSSNSSSFAANSTHDPSNQITVIISPLETPTIHEKYPTTAPTVKPSSTRTQTMDPTGSFLATEQETTKELNESIKKTVTSFGVDCDMRPLISPDGKWLVCSQYYLPNNTGFYVKNYSEKDFQDINNSQILVDSEEKEYWNLWPIVISHDSAYLYFSSYLEVDGGGPVCFFGYGANGLYKMNLETKKIDPIIIPDHHGFQNIFYKFSPTERRLAYYSFEGQKTLHILDLKTGENIAYELSEHLNDYLTWSPDGTQLAFSTGLDDWENVNSSTITILDNLTGEMKTVYHSTDQCLSIIEWNPDNILSVRGRNFDSPETIMEINLNTNSISLLTPTPNP